MDKFLGKSKKLYGRVTEVFEGGVGRGKTKRERFIGNTRNIFLRGMENKYQYSKKINK